MQRKALILPPGKRSNAQKAVSCLCSELSLGHWADAQVTGVHPNLGPVSITVLTPLLLAPCFIALNSLFVCPGPYLGSTFPPICGVLATCLLCLPLSVCLAFAHFLLSPHLSLALYRPLCLSALGWEFLSLSIFLSLFQGTGLCHQSPSEVKGIYFPSPPTSTQNPSGRTKWKQGLKMPSAFYNQVFFKKRISRI